MLMETRISNLEKSIKINFFRILPEFEARVQFKKSESLTFNYRMNNQFTDVTNLAEGLVLNNFDRLSLVTLNYRMDCLTALSLFYRSFNLFNNTNVFARVAYNKNIDQIRSIANFDNVISTSTFFNSQFADETYQHSVLGTKIWKNKNRLRANFNYSLRNQFIDGRQSVNESFVQSYTPEFRTNFREAPNVRLDITIVLVIIPKAQEPQRLLQMHHQLDSMPTYGIH